MDSLLKIVLPGLALALSSLAAAGELSADAFVAKQNGSLRIPLSGGRWQLTDTERNGPTSVATLRRSSAINDTHPTCDVTSAPGMANTASHEEIAAVMAKGMRDAGMDLGPMEVRSYGGRPALRFNTVLNRSGGAAQGDAYILRGDKDYFFVICSASSTAYSAARGEFDALVESIRY